MFFKSSRAGVDFLVVGLGNPGKKYEKTRHNAGFQALDALSARYAIRVTRSRFQGLTGEGRVDGVRVVLLKPMTFMNLSGPSVRAAADYYKIQPANILVLFDDISLPPGVIRIRADGSAGGHNGLRSIIDYLESSDFPRIKIGVGDRYPGTDLADWVTAPPSAADRKAIESRTDDVLTAISLIVSGKLPLAQSRFNG